MTVDPRLSSAVAQHLREHLRLTSQAGSPAAVFFRGARGVGGAGLGVLVMEGDPSTVLPALSGLIEEHGVYGAQKGVLVHHWFILPGSPVGASTTPLVDGMSCSALGTIDPFSRETRPLVRYIYVVEEDGAISWAETDGEMLIASYPLEEQPILIQLLPHRRQWNELQWLTHRHEGCSVE